MKRLLILTALLLAATATGETREIRHGNLDIIGEFGHANETIQQHVALGHVPGAYTVNKFGYNAAVTGAPEESIWDAPDLGGPLRCFTVLDQTPATVYFSSSNAADAGKTVTVEGLTTGYVTQNTTVTLGVAAATSGTVFTAGGTWLRINRMYAASDGLTGDIYAHVDATDADTNGIPDSPSTEIVAVITAGENQTLQACYTVPDGKIAMAKHACISNTTLGGADSVDFRSRIELEGGPNRTQNLYTLGAGATVCFDLEPARVFPEHSDIEITGSGTTQAASATFGLLIMPENYQH
jgi:hypothetical protein